MLDWTKIYESCSSETYKCGGVTREKVSYFQVLQNIKAFFVRSFCYQNEEFPMNSETGTLCSHILKVNMKCKFVKRMQILITKYIDCCLHCILEGFRGSLLCKIGLPWVFITTWAWVWLSDRLVQHYWSQWRTTSCSIFVWWQKSTILWVSESCFRKIKM